MTEIYYLHLDDGVLSINAKESPSCIDFQVSIIDGTSIYAENLSELFPKIVYGILCHCAVIVNGILIVRSSKMLDISDKNLFSLYTLAKLAISSFQHFVFTIDDNVPKSVSFALAKLQDSFGQLLNYEWRNNVANMINDLNDRLHNSCGEEISKTASHIILPLFWQYRAKKLLEFIKGHPKIVGISFTAHYSRYSAYVERDDNQILSAVEICESIPNLEHISTDSVYVLNSFKGVQLKIQNLISLALHVQKDDQLAWVLINQFPQLQFLLLKCQGSLSCATYDSLIEMIRESYTLRSVELPHHFGPDDNTRVNFFLSRNAQLEWNNVHCQVLDFCIGFSSLDLPPYVLEEIFNWLPMMNANKENENLSLMHKANHFKKIQLIVVRKLNK